MKLVNKKSSVISEGKPKLPTSDQLVYGEIAVNYADSYEALAIKNSSNNIVTFITSSQTNNLINSAITSALTNIEGTDIIVGDDITVSGITFVNSGDTLYSGLSSLVKVIVDDEETTANALLELHDEVNAISGAASGISNIQSAITAEVNRATAAEGALSGSIVSVSSALTQETNRAIEVEGGLSNRIGDVVSFASGISSDLSDEITRASGAEATLSGRIDTLSGRMDNALTVISVNSTTLNTGNTAVTLDSSNINVVSAISYSGETIVASGDSIQSAMSKIVNSLFGKLGEANVEIVSATPSSTNVREEWKLVDSAGTQHGESIKIYKDSSLIYPYLGHVDDALVNSASTAVTSGSGDTALCFVYQKADGTYELVAVNVESFLEESEFSDGLDVTNHVVSVKKDPTSEEYLTVSSNGVKISGIKDKLDNALSSVTINGEVLNSGNTEVTLDGNDILVGSSVTRSGITVIESSDTVYQGFSAMMTVIATNEEVTANALLELRDDVNDVSGATSAVSNLQSAITAEVTRATNAENALSGRIDGVTGNIQTLSATVSGLSSDLSDEVTRATGVENTLSGRIDTVTGNVQTLSGVVSGLSSDISGEVARATAAEAVLSGMIGEFLTEVSVNGNVLNTGATAVTLDGEDILVGGDVVRSGNTVISSSDTVYSGFTKLLSVVTDNEEVTANALLELHDEVNAISGATSGISSLQSAITAEVTRATSAETALSGRIDNVTGDVNTVSGNLSTLSGDVNTLSGDVNTISGLVGNSLTEISVNGTVLNSGNTAVTVNSNNINVVSAIAHSGDTIVASGDTIQSAMSKIVEALYGEIDDLAGQVSYSIVSATPSSTNVREEWKLVNSAGTQFGETIKVYKDSSLIYPYLGHVDDTLVDSASTAVTSGSGDTALCFIYQKADGTYELVAVNVESFLEENEFGDGLDVTNHVVSVKKDSTSEEYLTISSNGVKISGIKDKLDNALSSVTINGETVDSANTSVTLDGNDILVGSSVTRSGITVIESSDTVYQGFSAMMEVIATNEEVTANALLELRDDINGISGSTSAISTLQSAITAEVTRATSAETGLGNRIDGVTGNIQTLSGLVSGLSSDLSGEVTRATNAENTLSGRIDTVTGNISTLSGIVSGLSSDISGEVTRATNAENALSGRIDTVTGNVSTLSGVVSGLSSDLSSETTRATNAEDALSGRIDTLSTSIGNALTAISVNSTTLNTGNTAVTINANSVSAVSAISHDGNTIVASGDSMQSAMSEIVETLYTELGSISDELSALTIVSATPSSTNVRDEWKLVDSAGTQHGSSIKIYKDSSLITPYLGHVDDTLVSSASTAVTSGSGDTALCFIYQTADGGYALVGVNVEAFLEESEFSDGLDVTNHVVSVKKDSTSEEYLTISSNGVKISGIKDKLDKSLSSFTINNKTVNSGNTTVELNGSDVKIGSAITHSGTTIINTGDTLYQAFSAIETTISDEETRAINAEDALSDRIDTVTGSVSTLSGTVSGLSNEVSELSELVAGSITELSINGTVLDSGNTAMTFEAVDVVMGSAITHSGNTIVGSGETVAEGMNDIVNMIVGNEKVMAASVLDLNDRVNAATSSITTVSGMVSTVSTNVNTLSGNVNTVSGDLHTLSGVVESMSGISADVVSTEVGMGSGITVSGVTIAESGDTVYDGMKNLFTEVLNNEKTVSTSLLDLDARITEISGSTSPDALTRVSVNGVSASTANTAITINGNQMPVGSEVTVSGTTFIDTSKTVNEGFVAMATAIMEISGQSGSAGLTGVSVNGVSASTANTAITINANDIGMGSAVTQCGVTFIQSSRTINEGFQDIASAITENERVMSQALIELHNDVAQIPDLVDSVSAISASTQYAVTSLTITTIVAMTQTQYDNLQTKDPTTLYVITTGTT